MKQGKLNVLIYLELQVIDFYQNLKTLYFKRVSY